MISVNVGGIVFFKNGNHLMAGAMVFADSEYDAAEKFRDKLLRTYKTPIVALLGTHIDVGAHCPLHKDFFIEINLN